jgi:hypothetical protein
LMMYGTPPPTPKETPGVLEDIFVKKEKMLEPEYVKILERQIKIRKDLEHGDVKELSGKELDQYLEDAEKFLKRLKTLFSQIEKKKEEENIIQTYEHVVTIIRDVLKIEGLLDKTHEKNLTGAFEEVVKKGLIAEKYVRMLKEVEKAKEDYEAGKLTANEIQTALKNGRELIKYLIEYVQRKRGRELEKAKIRVKHGNSFGEVILLGKEAFIIHDIDHEEKEISRADINDDGTFQNVRPSSMEELEHSLTRLDILPRVFVKERIFENLKNVFGKDVEILLNY